MKQILLLSLFIVSGTFCIERNFTIIDYDSSHKNAVIEIAFQDPEYFFVGSSVVTNGLMTVEQFCEQNKDALELALANPLYIRRVIIDNGQVAGFVFVRKDQAMSVESLKRFAQERNLPFDEEQVLSLRAIMPDLKKTDAECPPFAHIESLAVSREFRGNGYGRALLRDAIENIKLLDESITYVKLDVNANNEIAIQLYESDGFVKSVFQPPHLVFFEGIEYRKEI